MADPNFALKKQWRSLPSLFLSLSTFFCCCLPLHAKISYPEHCGETVPQASSSSFALDTTNFIYLYDGRFSGGDKIINADTVPGSFSFHANHVYRTDKPGLFHLAGSIYLQGTPAPHRSRSSRRSIRRRRRYRHGFHSHGFVNYVMSSVNFDMAGFWSSTTGKICMVGTGSRYVNGTSLKLSAVFNLNYPNSSNIHTSIVSGTLRSVDASESQTHFDKISVLGYVYNNYAYTESSRLSGGMCHRVNVPKQVVGFEAGSASNYIPQLLTGVFRLEYGRDCSDQNCGPFYNKKNNSLEFSPPFMAIGGVQSREEGKVHMQVVFNNASRSHDGYGSSLIPVRSLVSEGYWDSERKFLCLLACPVLKEQEDSAGVNYVGECTIGLGFWFPSVYTLKERSGVVGRIWSVNGKSDPGYFSPIPFRSLQGHNGILHGVKYEYTRADSVRDDCETTEVENLGNRRYPDENTIEDFRFDITLGNATDSSAWGYATPFSFGDDLYGRGFLGRSYLGVSSGVSFSEKSVDTNKSVWDVSYLISYSVYSSSSDMETLVDIAAEGVYNAEAGKLCMVGCKKGGSLETPKGGKGEDPADCQIEIRIQLSPLNMDTNGSINSGTRHVNGTIRSTRATSDPLYFEPLDISSYNMYNTAARETATRMDMEIAMVMVSLTLSCVFVIFQIFHVRKHQDVLPSMSITMLIILTLGYMVPLVLSFEALFLMSRGRKSVMLWSGRWLEVKEVLTRVLTMAAFLLQCRLLQLAWAARSSKEGGRGLWVAEMKSLRLCLPLYFAGALIAWFVRTKSYKTQDETMDYNSDRNRSMGADLISYIGLILDGFLLPQILLNISRNSKDKALVPLFYIGITGVRVLPHLYDAYRASHYAKYFKFSYIYASPDGDYYSTAWDIIIPSVGVLFAVLLFLQQRFGASCFLPQRFRKLSGYEAVPVISL